MKIRQVDPTGISCNASEKPLMTPPTVNVAGCPRLYELSNSVPLFFLFQAEDGIRSLTVTGVQTCALPIFGHRLGLDLPDPLPGDPVDLADLVQRLGLAVGQAEPHGDHPGLPLGERGQHR